MKLSAIRTLAIAHCIALTTNGKRTAFTITPGQVAISTKLNAALTEKEVIAAFNEANDLASTVETIDAVKMPKAKIAAKKIEPEASGLLVTVSSEEKDDMAKEVITQYVAGVNKWLIVINKEEISESLVRNILNAAEFPKGKRKAETMLTVEVAYENYSISLYRSNRNAKKSNK